jgi:DNA-directed RNA polymerase subunit RPC12/RpoP
MKITWFYRNCNIQLENPFLDTNEDNVQCLYCGSKQIEKR